jgi:hypothetical protein
MIAATFRARVIKDPPDALAWAAAIGALVKKKAGVDMEVLVRMGATQDIVWSQRYADLASYGKALEAIQADPEYQAQVKVAQDKGFFDLTTLEAGIWRVL